MISAGILPSGFCWRSESLASVGSAFSIVTSLSSPRMPSASFTLRPNGDGGEERRIIMWVESGSAARERADQFAKRRPSAGDDQVHGLRPLALLVRFDVEGNALAFIERLHSGSLDRRDVHEHVPPAVVRFDEAVATLRIEELDGTTLRHREAPFSQRCPTTGPPRHGSSAGHSHEREKRRHPESFPPAPDGGGTSKPAGEVDINCAALERGGSAAPRPRRRASRAGCGRRSRR